MEQWNRQVDGATRSVCSVAVARHVAPVSHIALSSGAAGIVGAGVYALVSAIVRAAEHVAARARRLQLTDEHVLSLSPRATLLMMLVVPTLLTFTYARRSRLGESSRAHT